MQGCTTRTRETASLGLPRLLLSCQTSSLWSRHPSVKLSIHCDQEHHAATAAVAACAVHL